jgi:hypothetical protein
VLDEGGVEVPQGVDDAVEGGGDVREVGNAPAND